MFSKAIVLLAIAAHAFATVSITSPIATTSFSGGQTATVSWIENNQAPTLKDFGPARISIYAGNALQQTSLQVASESVDVSTTSTFDFKVDPSIGPNSKEYFIRIESLSLKDASQPQYPALAFSAKFQLTDMTGTFSAAVLAQIEGQSTAPLPGATSAASAVTSPTGSGASKAISSATSAKASASASAKPSAKPTGNGALSNTVGLAGLFVSALVAATLL